MRLSYFLFVFVILSFFSLNSNYANAQACEVSDHCGDGICGSTVEIENCNTCPQDCAPPNYGQPCGSCGGVIQCDGSCSVATPINYGQACGNCGTIDCSGACIGEGLCSPGSTQCSNGLYQTCLTGCGWTNAGTDADNDGADQQCEDTTCDNAPGVCDTAVSGKCIATSAEICTDNLDNDCDGLKDCQDSDCAGSISGNVKNTDNQNVADAVIDVLQGASSRYTSSTSPSGNYQINNVLCGTYNMVASAVGYIPSTQTNIYTPPVTAIIVDFIASNALVTGSTCEDDCTYAMDSIIHEECNGINGCSFNDTQAALVCDLAQPGWIRDYSATQQVECGEGAPFDKVEVKATVTCAKENLIKTTRVVNYQGRLVKIIVAVCG